MKPTEIRGTRLICMITKKQTWRISWNRPTDRTLKVDHSCFFFLINSGCEAPLGMDSGAITDAQITASSQWDANHAAIQARLHFKKVTGKAGSWSARKNDLNQWLQVDLGGFTTITRVATQGRNGVDQWVTQYRLQYSDDGVTFQFYKKTRSRSPKVSLQW